jgi:predicted nucleic acid-binding protein
LSQKIPFGINSLIYQEVLQGAKTEEEYHTLKTYHISQHFFHPKDPVDSFTRAARIYFDCRKNGITIRSTIDCIIAQTTIEHKLHLLHNDRDFEAISKVKRLRFY